MFLVLLDRIDIAGAVVTADASSAISLACMPSSRACLGARSRSPTRARERGHGRTERRTLKVTAVAAGLALPHAAQAIQIVRRRTVKGKWSAETCYAVTSLTATQAAPRRARRHHPRPPGQ